MLASALSARPPPLHALDSAGPGARGGRGRPGSRSPERGPGRGAVVRADGRPARLLVRLPSWLGDFVMAEPVVRAAWDRRRSSPGSEDASRWSLLLLSSRSSRIVFPARAWSPSPRATTREPIEGTTSRSSSMARSRACSPRCVPECVNESDGPAAGALLSSRERSLERASAAPVRSDGDACRPSDDRCHDRSAPIASSSPRRPVSRCGTRARSSWCPIARASWCGRDSNAPEASTRLSSSRSTSAHARVRPRECLRNRGRP